MSSSFSPREHWPISIGDPRRVGHLGERAVRFLATSWIVLFVFVATSLAVASTVTYTYDDLGRLRTVTHADGTVINYDLDAVRIPAMPGRRSEGSRATIPVQAGLMSGGEWTVVENDARVNGPYC
jgi:YD repeat-containing protein